MDICVNINIGFYPKYSKQRYQIIFNNNILRSIIFYSRSTSAICEYTN